MGGVFIDTNILVYAVDKDAGEKSMKAKAALAPFYQTDRRPMVSAQVVHEFSFRLYRWGLTDQQVRPFIEPMRYWQIIPNDFSLYEQGIVLKRKHCVSFWDCLILAAAQRAGADELWSEDFNAGQMYDGVRAVNPLL